jgi:hypothetical protein
MLTCVATAERVLRDAVKGRSDADFVEEFAAYWGGDYVYVDLDDGARAGEIAWVALRPEPAPVTGILTAKSALATTFLDRHRESTRRGEPPQTQPCPILDLEVALTVDPRRAWPPTTLGALCTWLDQVAPGATSKLERRFPEVVGDRRCFGLRAANGLFLVSIEIPPAYQKPEFLNNRRHRLFGILRQSAQSAPIKRVSTMRIDTDYLFARNLTSGAGAIGRWSQGWASGPI